MGLIDHPRSWGIRARMANGKIDKEPAPGKIGNIKSQESSDKYYLFYLFWGVTIDGCEQTIMWLSLFYPVATTRSVAATKTHENT